MLKISSIIKCKCTSLPVHTGYTCNTNRKCLSAVCLCICIYIMIVEPSAVFSFHSFIRHSPFSIGWHEMNYFRRHIERRRGQQQPGRCYVSNQIKSPPSTIHILIFNGKLLQSCEQNDEAIDERRNKKKWRRREKKKFETELNTQITWWKAMGGSCGCDVSICVYM